MQLLGLVFYLVMVVSNDGGTVVVSADPSDRDEGGIRGLRLCRAGAV